MKRLKKKLSLFLSFTLLMVQIISSPLIGVQALTSTSILKDAEIGVDKAVQWAKNNHATAEFVELAKLYWELSPKSGGIDPAAAYAQAAKETDFGRFKEGIDESYHNPVLFKSTSKDIIEYHKFSTWKDGISAHLDHLALYAGAVGYPKTKDTLDPLHNEALFGTVKNLEGLSKTWSQSETYGEELIAMVKDMKDTKVKEPLKKILVVEAPSSYEVENNKDLAVKGYALNASNVKKVNIYLDTILIGAAEVNIERVDLEKQFSLYPNSGFSGFEFKINAKSLTVGKHLIEVEAVGYDKTVEKKSIEINVRNLPDLFKVEKVIPDDLTDTKAINIDGWALGVKGVEKINIYINDKLAQSSALNTKREDINKTYPGYPEGVNNAFKASLKADTLSQGKYKIKVEAVYKDGTKLSEVKDVEVSRKKTDTNTTAIEEKSMARNFSVSSISPSAASSTPINTFGNKKLIVIDAGHGGKDPGAIATHNGIQYKEAELNLNMANRIRQKLEGYGYAVAMTRNQHNETKELSERTAYANSLNPIFFLSVHHDSYSGPAKGSSSHYSTYKPNIDNSGIYVKDGIYYDSTPSQAAKEGQTVAQNLATAMARVGFYNRGSRDHNLYVTKNTNMASALVECGFITSPIDILMIKDTFKQELMAQNIAITIKNQYGEPVDLPPNDGTPSIAYKSHVSEIGWQNWVKNGSTSGTEGRGLKVEAMKLQLQNYPGLSISYRAHVQDIGWQNWVKDGEMIGTTGRALKIEALQIKLEGTEASKYSVQYQAHVQDIGWQPWVMDGQVAGTTGKNKRVEAVRVKIIPKLLPLPNVVYQGHVSEIGWQSWIKNGETAGTTGRALRLEGINIKLENKPSDLNITYRAHVQDIGWQSWVTEGKTAGTTGRALKIEALEIKLTGANSSKFAVEYQGHVEGIGWQPWVRDGQLAGTTGRNLRMEALKIRIVRK